MIAPKQRFFYCPKCGGELHYRPQNGHPRLTCQACHHVCYENPIVGVAAIVMNEAGHLLLGRRTGGEYKDLWCIPCGYLEYDEDVYTGIRREFKEETNLDIEIRRVFTVQSNFHDPNCHTVGIWFLADVGGGEMQAGDDLCELAFFPLQSVPPLAFPTDQTVIDLLAQEASGGQGG